MSDKKPTKAIYDFHHNLRAYDWSNPRVHTEDGFHTKVYLDAGGHRSLYAPGNDISVQLASVIENRLYTGLDGEVTQPLSRTYWGITFSHLSQGGITTEDLTFGAMIKYLGVTTVNLPWPWGTQYFPRSDGSNNLAYWRGEKYQDWLVSLPIFYPADSYNGKYAADETNKKLKVESFQHWVWVAGVDDKYSDTDDKVSYTWSGEDVHNIQGVDSNGIPNRYLWPISANSPWNTGPSYEKVKDDPTEKASYFRSSTEMVWKWKQYTPDKSELVSGKWAYSYDWSSNLHPDIFTRYYDGSG